MRKDLYSVVTLLLPLSTLACTQPHAEPTAPIVMAADQPVRSFVGAAQQGYIVTAKDEASVRRIFAQQGVTVLRSLGNGQFELHLQNDPGLSVVTEMASRSGGIISAVQTNQSYQAF